MRKLLALMLILSMLLSGCFFPWAGSYYTAYADMEYVRPDMEQIRQALDAACDAAENAHTLRELENRILEYYDVYDDFYTNCNLAYIRYCQDMTDIYWDKEYSYCTEHSATLDAGLDTLYRALARSPYRQELEGDDYFGAGFFDAYEGDSLWDDTFLAYMEEEAALVDEYYALCAESAQAEYYSEEFFTDYGSKMAQVFLELVALRQEQAAYAGYDSYPEFAYDFYFYRDYSPQEAVAYFETIQKKMVSLYRRMDASALMAENQYYSSEAETLDYVREAATAMGGDIQDAFSLLEGHRLYDIGWNENKYDISFEVFLDSYYTPFVFMCPYGTQYDKLTLAHEFGHFVNDYVCGGSYAGTDVAEVHSQAMEYLSLCYARNTEALEEMKLADSLCIYVEQSAYSLFEHKVYTLSPQDLTVENIQALYTDIGVAFGFETQYWDPRDYVLITHLFIEPMYMASYVASNDVAFQLYQLEKAQPGSGLEIYKQCLSSQDSYLVAFAEAYGLENPLSAERVLQVCRTLDPLLP